MAENVTTLNEIRNRMAAGELPSLTDLIYAVRGTGSNREKAFTLEEVRNLLLAIIATQSLTASQKVTAPIFENNENDETLSVFFRITQNLIHLHDSFQSSPRSFKVSYDATNHKYVLNMDGDISADNITADVKTTTPIIENNANDGPLSEFFRIKKDLIELHNSFQSSGKKFKVSYDATNHKYVIEMDGDINVSDGFVTGTHKVSTQNIVQLTGAVTDYDCANIPNATQYVPYFICNNTSPATPVSVKAGVRYFTVNAGHVAMFINIGGTWFGQFQVSLQ